MTILNYSGKSQGTVDYKMAVGRPGFYERILLSDTYYNGADELPKIATVTLATSSGDIVVSINGISVTTTFDTDDATTAALIAANLIADTAINADVKVSVAGAVVTIEGRYTGDDFVIAATGTGATLAVTQAATVSTDIPYGRVVAYKVGDPVGSVRLPAGAADVVTGVAGSDIIVNAEPDSVYTNFKRGEPVPVISQGLVWVEVESAVTLGSVPYYRHTADGSLDKLGAIAGASGTGLTILSGAKFESASYTVDGVLIALLSINRP